MKTMLLAICGKIPLFVYVLFGMMFLQPDIGSEAAAQGAPDEFQRQHIEAVLLTDGSLQLTENRTYRVNPFRTHIFADIPHQGRELRELEVFLNGERLDEAAAPPAHLTDPSLEPSGSGYVLRQHDGFVTLLIFGRFGNTALRLQYQLSDAVARAGNLAYLQYGFGQPEHNFAFEEARNRPTTRDLTISMDLRFEEPAAEIVFARLFSTIDGTPVPLQVSAETVPQLRLAPVRKSTQGLLDLRLLFSPDAVPGLPPGTQEAPVSPETLEAAFELLLTQAEADQRRESELAQKRTFADPVGWLMLVLTLYTIVARRLRKRSIKKQAEALDFNQPLTLADVRRLPLGVVNTLYRVQLLQPRNRVLRLTGTALLDLARAGHLRMEIRIPETFLTDSTNITVFGRTANRKMLPFGIKQLLEKSVIIIQPLPETSDSSLRPWHKMLLAYVRSRSKGDAISLRELFPSKTGLKELSASGPAGAQQAEALKASLKKLKEGLRDSYIDDLTGGLKLFAEQRNPLFISLTAVLIALYLIVVQSFLGLFLLLFAVPALFLALLNRYEHTAEGYRLSRMVREHINKLRKSGSPAPETAKAEDLLADFMVLNWPRNYTELHHNPFDPLYRAAKPGNAIGLSALENIRFTNPQPDAQADKLLHFTTYILQETTHRSLMHYPDIVATKPDA